MRDRFPSAVFVQIHHRTMGLDVGCLELAHELGALGQALMLAGHGLEHFRPLFQSADHPGVGVFDGEDAFA